MEKRKQHCDSKNRKSVIAISVMLIITMILSMTLVSCSLEYSTAQGDKAGSDITSSQSEDDDESGDNKNDENKDKSDESDKADKKDASDTGKKSGNSSGNKEGAEESAAAQTTQARSVCYISIDGYCSGKSVEVRSGDTVYSILCRSGASVSGSSSYVKGINGLYEFDEGPQSGWKYSVNGVTPGVGCGSYSVKAGDSIRWYYVTHL